MNAFSLGLEQGKDIHSLVNIVLEGLSNAVRQKGKKRHHIEKEGKKRFLYLQFRLFTLKNLKQSTERKKKSY